MLIEFQTASQGATVTESKEFADAVTGQKREVDIVIETREGTHSFIIGVECTDRSRPMDETWIEAVYGKHRNIPVNKTIVVSRSGFYQPALLKAKERKIEALTFEQALTTDWAAVTNRLKELKDITVEAFLPLTIEKAAFGLVPNYATPPQIGTIGETLLYGPDDKNYGNTFDIIQQFLSDPNVVKATTDKALENPNMNINCDFDIPLQAGCYIFDLTGTKYLVAVISVRASCRQESQSIPLARANYGDNAVLHGKGEFLGSPVELSFVEQSDGQLTFGATIQQLIQVDSSNPEQKK